MQFSCSLRGLLGHPGRHEASKELHAAEGTWLKGRQGQAVDTCPTRGTPATDKKRQNIFAFLCRPPKIIKTTNTKNQMKTCQEQCRHGGPHCSASPGASQASPYPDPTVALGACLWTVDCVFLTVDSFSILFNHRSFQTPAASSGLWVVF